MEVMRALQQRVLRKALLARPGILRQSFRQINHSSQQPFRTRPSTLGTATRTSRGLWSSFVAHKFPRGLRFPRRFQSTVATASNANLSLSQRLRKLSREYGWSALGIYLLLSALDFPFCFLAVKLLGTDRIGHWEHVIVSWVKSVIKWPLPDRTAEQIEDVAKEMKEMVVGEEGQGGVGMARQRLLEEDPTFAKKGGADEVGVGKQRLLEVDEAYAVEDHGYKEAEKAANREDASLWTQLVFAYAIHKSFMFIRVPLTAAVTPKVVKTLRGWGWNIGKMPKKKTVVSSTGVNTKGTGVKPE